MSKKKFLIFPYNGNAIEALDCIDEDQYKFIGFIDDDPARTDSDYEVYRRDILERHKELYLLAVPGSPLNYKQRSSIIEALQMPRKRFVTIIHPSARLGKNVSIGTNCLLMAGTVLTSNATIGDHVCILPNSVVHHDSVIGDFTMIGSNVSVAGGVITESCCYIASGSNIINGIRIGSHAMIGLGSNVITNVDAHAKVAGNPARKLNPVLV